MKKLFSNDFVPIVGKWYFTLGFLLLGVLIFMLENSTNSSLKKTKKPINTTDVYSERFTNNVLNDETLGKDDKKTMNVMVNFQDYWLKGTIDKTESDNMTQKVDVVEINIDNNEESISSVVVNVYPQLTEHTIQEKQKVYIYSDDEITEGIIKKLNSDDETIVVTNMKKPVEMTNLYLISNPAPENKTEKEINVLLIIIYSLISLCGLLILILLCMYFLNK